MNLENYHVGSSDPKTEVLNTLSVLNSIVGYTAFKGTKINLMVSGLSSLVLRGYCNSECFGIEICNHVPDKYAPVCKSLGIHTINTTGLTLPENFEAFCQKINYHSLTVHILSVEDAIILGLERGDGRITNALKYNDISTKVNFDSIRKRILDYNLDSQYGTLIPQLDELADVCECAIYKKTSVFA
jgi:hypothetical protein